MTLLSDRDDLVAELDRVERLLDRPPARHYDPDNYAWWRAKLLEQRAELNRLIAERVAA